MSQQTQPRPYQLFMLGLCVYVLIALAAQTFFPVSEGTNAILDYVDTGICIIFLADFFYCLATAESRWRYLRWGWIDLVSSIPMVGILRWGRIARVVRILRVLRAVRSTKVLTAYILKRRAESAFTAAALISILLLVFSSIAMMQIETGPQANIKTAEDALWWSFVTITTVGYGDHYPVTALGRCIAVVLMVAGVGLFGTFTGFVASWFLAVGEEQQEDELTKIRDELAALRAALKTRH